MNARVRRTFWALVLAVGLFGASAGAAFGADSFTPNPVVVTLQAGQSTTVTKTLHLDALPGAADILIAIDTTGSMNDAIVQAKAQATQLCTDVQMAIPGARFAVWDFKDIPDRPATNGILKSVNLFTSSCAAIQAAINLMTASGGSDNPEAYNPVFHDAYADLVLNGSRNPNAVQFLVVLGDAAPHNTPALAAFPACGNTPPADPGMNSATETAGLSAAEITLLMIHYQQAGTSTPLACHQQLAAATGGTAVSGGSDLSDDITSQILAAAAEVDQVSLLVSGAGCQTPAGLNISFIPPNPPPYGPFTAPVNINFQETITAPTLPGNYSCTVTAVVDGTPRATQTINATVTAGAPATVVVTPPTGVNTVGDEHCVTATVRDAFGNLVPGATVTFTVTGPATASPAGGTATTNANGQATFCFVGTDVGTDVITASVPGAGGVPVRGTATKTFTPPSVDHYKCYDAKEKKKTPERTVVLTDQFVTNGRAKVQKLDGLCNPASKNDEPIFQGDAHLTRYAIKESKTFDLNKKVEVTNQFGTERFRVDKAKELLVPASKSEIPPAIPGTNPGPSPRFTDHYLCYDLKDADKSRIRVTLVDQFGSEKSDVGKAERLCNPVSKDGGRVLQPDVHLVCYDLDKVKRGHGHGDDDDRYGHGRSNDDDDDDHGDDDHGDDDDHGHFKWLVNTNDQFGLSVLRVSESAQLCVPSTKRVL